MLIKIQFIKIKNVFNILSLYKLYQKVTHFLLKYHYIYLKYMKTSPSYYQKNFYIFHIYKNYFPGNNLLEISLAKLEIYQYI